MASRLAWKVGRLKTPLRASIRTGTVMLTHCFAAVGSSSRDATGNSSDEYMMVTSENEQWKRWCADNQ